jgi:hypothetical protein
MTMQVFVREYGTMIAASVQSDVDGIPKGAHDVLLKRLMIDSFVNDRLYFHSLNFRKP